jgi:hypothetical protein
MQNPRATTSLKPGVCDVFIAKRISQMNNGHHRRKWKSPILGVDKLCFVTVCDVFFASIFLVYVEPKLFFSLSGGKILQCSPYYSHNIQHQPKRRHYGCLKANHKILSQDTSINILGVITVS